MPDITPREIETLRGLFAGFAPGVGLALSEQVNQMAEMELVSVSEIAVATLLNSTDTVLSTHFTLNAPFTGESIILMTEEGARILSALLKGEIADDATVPDETQLGNVMNGVARGLAVCIANMTSEGVEVDSCSSQFAPLSIPPIFAISDGVLEILFNVVIPGQETFTLSFVLTPDMIRALSQDEEPAVSGEGILGEDELAAILGGMGGDTAPSAPAGIPAFGQQQSHHEANIPQGMDLILDIPLEVTVELGRVRMLIRDVLQLTSGSIVELDRVAGEPVDLLVNGRLIAKGEVVVIEDNFGIRVTEIISPADRVSSLGRGA